MKYCRIYQKNTEEGRRSGFDLRGSGKVSLWFDQLRKISFSYSDLKLDRMRELVNRLSNPRMIFPPFL